LHDADAMTARDVGDGEFEHGGFLEFAVIGLT
jgi:hypothetical protein